MRTWLLLFAILSSSTSAHAQLSLSSAGTPATADFTGYDGSGFASTPAAGQLDSDTWRITGLSDGDSVFGDTRSSGDFARGLRSGAATTGGIYAFEAAAAGNPAIGVQPSAADFTPGTITLRLQNDTGGLLTRVDVTFTGYQFNDGGWSTAVTMDYSTDDSTWVPTSLMLFTTGPAASSATWLPLPQTVTITGLAIPNGSMLYLRWAADDVPGGASNRDQLAIDDIVVTPGCATSTDCNDGNRCTTDSCSAVGTCSYADSVGTPCPDGDVCNGDEVCGVAGACGVGTPLDCMDANPCTDDSCDAVTGCMNASSAAGIACPDGDLCNGDETCDGSGSCGAGTPPDCDDTNPCTDDFCDPATGCESSSSAAGTSCPDLDLCNGDETCDGAGACQTGSALACDDGLMCTTDACDPATGCSTIPIVGCCGDASDCIDGDACTMDACRPDGTCFNPPIPGCTPDAGTIPVDAGPGPDAGGRDGGSGTDAGPATTRRGDGCGCHAAGQRDRSPFLLMFVLGVAVLLRRWS